MSIKDQIAESEKEIAKIEKQEEKLEKQKQDIYKKIWSIRINVSMTIDQMKKICRSVYGRDTVKEPYKSMYNYLHDIEPDGPWSIEERYLEMADDLDDEDSVLSDVETDNSDVKTDDDPFDD